MRISPAFVLLFAAYSAGSATLAQEASQNGDIEVTVSLGPGEQSGNARGTVRIHASRETVWSFITSCPESVRMVPGLEACEVLETAPDQSWQRIRQVMNYSWLVPKLTYVIRASYDPPTRVGIERMSGDLRTLRGTWDLQSDGAYTIAHYMVELAPGFWVPHWIVRSALRKDLPKMLRALRARAEAAPQVQP
ncbi:MAG: SRPBCC family protein [Pseudomonadota bacterium]|nr:SRPBCC family protein [Pseudomonadota bacterium]